jgi:hypothetical protein
MKASPENQLPFEKMELLLAELEFYEVVYGTPTVLKRDPRRNFLEDLASIGLSVGALYSTDTFTQIYKWY